MSRVPLESSRRAVSKSRGRFRSHRGSRKAMFRKALKAPLSRLCDAGGRRPVRGRRDLSMSSFKGCVICKGSSGRTRNGAGGRTCRASTCKAAYKERRARAGGDAGYTALEDMAAAFDEMMPEGTWLQELDEILGERCCELRKLSHKKRKNGPGIVSAAIPGAWQIP